jgi:carbohydrate diacid regulator
LGAELEFPVELAEKIVNMLFEVTGNNVNFMDNEGVIIATMQPERLGTVHEGAKLIMSGEIDELAISVEAAKNLTGEADKLA